MSALLFTSCENFLNNKDVKDEILDVIAYNNTPSCTVLFRADDSSGTFLTSNEKSCKIGYDAQVEFELNKDNYIFIGFEAVSKSDTTKSREDCVQITPVNYDEKKGNYVINLKVIKEVNDILIRPKCILIPAIKEISPKFESSGCDQDKPIIIEFNKPVNVESVKTKGKIEIYSDSESLADNFNLAGINFSADGTTLSIKTTDKLLLPPDSEKNTMTVFVNYDFSEAIDSDNQKMNIKGTYEYRVNKTYGNQVKVKVYAQSDSGIQLALNAGDYKECTVGYSADINYTFDSLSYYFAGFEAVKYSDPQVNVDNLVSVESIMINQSSGAYKAHITVLDGEDDILIKLKTGEFPAVAAIDPSTSTEEINSNKPIIITFNTPVESEEILAENSIFNYKNILLTCKDSNGNTVDVSKYFNEPYFNKQKTKLTISPKPLELENFIANILKTSDVKINVYLKDTIIISKEGKDFTLKQDAKTNFYVCYNTNLETVKPTKINLFATRDALSLKDNSVAICEQLNFGNINDMTSNQIIQNRVKDFIYIYGNYYDKDSGVSKVSITIDNNDSDIIDLNSSNVEFFRDDEGNTRFCLKYDLDLDNGAYCIKVNVLDACDNLSETESFYVISKKSYSRDELRFNIENGPIERLEASYDEENMQAFRDHLQEIGFSAFVQEYNNAKKQLRIFDTSYYYSYEDEYDNTGEFTTEDSYILMYENAKSKAKYSIEDIKLYCKYIDKNGQLKTQEFTAFDEQKGYRSLDMDMDTIYGESITIIAEDDFGAQGSFSVTFPPRTEGHIYTYGDNFYMLNVSQHKGYLVGAELDENDIETGRVDFTNCFFGGQFNEPDYYDKLWFFYWSYDEYGNALCSDFFDWNSSDSEELEITDYEITKDENNHVIITFNFAEDTWEKFDEIRLYPTNWNYNHYYYEGNIEEEHIIEKGTMSYTYTRGDNYYTNSSGLYYFYKTQTYYNYGSFDFAAYKKGYLLGSKIISFDELGIDETEYDDKPPKIEIIDAESLDKITFIAEDILDGSGPVAEGGTIKFYNTKTGQFDKTLNLVERDIDKNGTTIKQCYASVKISDIQKYIVYDGKNMKLPYTYTVKDAAGNITQDCSSEVAINICSAYCSTINLENNYFTLNSYGTYSIYKCDVQHREWDIIPLNDSTGGYSSKNLYVNTEIYTDTLEDSFIKFCVYRNKTQTDNKKPAWSAPRYKYTGRKGTGENNYIIKNGNDHSVVVCSDAPVFIHFYQTNVSYDICNDWTVDQWLFWGEETFWSNAIIDFEEGNTTPKVYSFGSSFMNYNYVIFAEFANGVQIMTGPIKSEK